MLFNYVHFNCNITYIDATRIRTWSPGERGFGTTGGGFRTGRAGENRAGRFGTKGEWMGKTGAVPHFKASGRGGRDGEILGKERRDDAARRRGWRILGKKREMILIWRCFGFGYCYLHVYEMFQIII